MATQNSPETNSDNVVSLIDEELTKDLSEKDLEMLQALAQKNGVNITEVLKSEEIRNELERINNDLEKQRKAFQSQEGIEETAEDQKEWYVGLIIKGMRKELAQPIEMNEESSVG